MATVSEVGFVSRKGGRNVQTGEIYEEQKWWVKFTDNTATTIEAENASGLPLFGAALGSTRLYVIEKAADQRENHPGFFDVTVTYRTLNPALPQPRLNATDTTWSVAKTLQGFPVEHEIQKDTNNKICVNVIGEPINPPIVEVKFDAQVHLTFLTTATSHGYYLSQTLGYVNSAAVTLTIGNIAAVFAAETLWFNNYSLGDAIDQDGEKCTSMAYDFQWRGDGWHEKRPHLSLMHGILSSGTLTLNSDGTVKTDHIKDNSSNNISEPRYLGDSGATLGQPLPNGSSIAVTDFTVKGTASFTNLLSLLAG